MTREEWMRLVERRADMGPEVAAAPFDEPRGMPLPAEPGDAHRLGHPGEGWWCE